MSAMSDYTLIIGVMFWYIGLTKVIKSDYGLMCKNF